MKNAGHRPLRPGLKTLLCTTLHEVCPFDWVLGTLP